MLNLKTRAAADTAVLELRDLDDSPLTFTDGKGKVQPVTVTVYGPGSRQYVAAKAAQQTRLVARVQRGKSLSESPEEQARHQAEFLAATTAAMDGIEYEGLAGRDLFLAVYSDPAIGFIAEQVAKFGADWANFSKGSAKS
jgi:hypothetical protein